jgi:hypothetical protein
MTPTGEQEMRIVPALRSESRPDSLRNKKRLKQPAEA